MLLGIADAWAPEQEDLGVLNQPVGDCGGNGRVIENIAPVGKRRVGGNNSRSFLAVAGGNNLIKQVRGLLIERQVTKLVNKCSAEHLLMSSGIWPSTSKLLTSSIR